MITAKFYDGNCIRLTVQGHGGGEYGTDIVCAGVSTLVTTLANWAMLLYEDKNLLAKPVIRLEPGDAIIEVLPRPQLWAMVRSYFGFVLVGLDGIAAVRPDAIEIDIDAAEAADDMGSPTDGQTTGSPTDGQEGQV